MTFESVSVAIAGSPGTSCLLSGSNAIITCNVEGFPRPEIDFLIGRVLVVPGAGSFDRVTRTEADQIRVENVVVADEGSYGCRVANDNTAPVTTADFQHCSESIITVCAYIGTVSGTPLIWPAESGQLDKTGHYIIMISKRCPGWIGSYIYLPNKKHVPTI